MTDRIDPPIATPRETVTVELYRFDPDTDAEPRFETCTVPMERQMRVLDALDHLYEQQGKDFAYRWYCGTKRCGMCGVSVNGRPQLSCWEPAEASMRIEPLPHFPVIRDLVVDFSANEQQLIGLHPIIERRDPYLRFPEPVTPDRMANHYKLMACIDCRVCDASCSVLDRPETGGFAGPYALVQLAKAASHVYDAADRVPAILSTHIERCLSCGDCVTACPNGVPILTGAIDPLRDRLIERGVYHVRGWRIIKWLPMRLRSFLRCRLGWSLGEQIVPQGATDGR
jgi:succinate dehydrogenase/fumarate reductase iron-sulfur protein